METEELAQQAVKTFEGATLNERAITVQIATPKPVETGTAKTFTKKLEKKPSAASTESAASAATESSNSEPATDVSSNENTASV
jgi:hypothetical protein